eukprot:gene8211-14866_t
MCVKWAKPDALGEVTYEHALDKQTPAGNELTKRLGVAFGMNPMMKKSYPVDKKKGMAQPGCFVFTKDGPIVQWVLKPTMDNMQGAMNRVEPSDLFSGPALRAAALADEATKHLH